MRPPAPSDDRIRRARIFWEQSRADRAEARRRLRAGECLDSSYFSYQAAINALTSVCYLHGEYRVPNHSATQMVGVLQGLAPEWAGAEGLLEAAVGLEPVQDMNPYAPERDPAEERRQGRLFYAHSGAILGEVKRFLKRNRKRFFAP